MGTTAHIYLRLYRWRGKDFLSRDKDSRACFKATSPPYYSLERTVYHGYLCIARLFESSRAAADGIMHIFLHTKAGLWCYDIFAFLDSASPSR